MSEPIIAGQDRIVFHIEGGAKFHGRTLTAWSSNFDEAKAEALGHFTLAADRGFWLFHKSLGPDCDGNRYHHFYWQGSAA